MLKGRGPLGEAGKVGRNQTMEPEVCPLSSSFDHVRMICATEKVRGGRWIRRQRAHWKTMQRPKQES